ncbi:histidine phosphatase family protein [Polynucleobacter sp. AM-25C3]|uniref:SixA phosphatase family protein n=1 Tax=Polynucleobacter sp. AM-25C3 TaxID=1855569 RepID=UPI001C0AB6B8|nr:histidine phosphatase family protein [Polynucleobacter sp. AM-25C3]MBU3601821.1 histidine phosphatase family protein [Polynucleobacter sp. AM-25C3]
MGSKSLFLLRHAKAAAGGILIADKDRPLSEKGVKDVGKLANKLSKKDLDFELIITSPAVRTISTAQIIAKGLKISHAHLVVNDSLYAAEAMNLLKVISSVSKKIDKLMVVGHNPGLMSLASLIAGEPISLSTCSLIKFSFDFKEWHHILTERASKFNFLN